jgi:tetratricopeptide (TPR) repeat protein
MDNANIQMGIQYFKEGNKTGALQIFLQVLEREPNNEIAWLWLAACVDKPEQKRDCFHKVLAINPNNANAQKALAELELQTIPEAKPIPQQGTVLKCPSCGSVMGKPDHTGLVQCGYCGTTITYHPPVEKVERKNIERYLEICKTALAGSNYDEAIQYANKILEIDPENFDAWINKATATFWLTTATNNRFDEAMEYVLKAEQIDKDSPLILETRKSLSLSQNKWYQYLGAQEREHAVKIYNIYVSQVSSITDAIFDPMEAKENSQEYYVKAMNYFLVALSYDSENYDTLTRIKNLTQEANWINWSSAVRDKIRLLERLNQKNTAVSNLPNLQRQLQEEQAKLAKLKKEKGFFTGMKIDSTTNKIKSLKQQIAQYERIVNSNQK